MPGQFSDFCNSLDPDPLKRDKQFEHFVLWFLKLTFSQCGRIKKWGSVNYFATRVQI